MTRYLTFVALVAMAMGVAQADQLPFGAATGYNVFVFSDFSEYGTSVQGKMAVGGNFAPGTNTGITIAGSSTDRAGTYDLVVGGSFTAKGYSMGGGDIYVGGNMTWTTPTMPDNAYVVGNFRDTSGGSVEGTIYYGGTYNGPGYLSHQAQSASSMPTPIDFLGAKTSLDALSATLASDAANGTVTQSSSTWTLTGADTNLNVFDLTATSYSGATISITAPTGSTVVVNVAGSADSFSGGSINLNGIPRSNVIFNFNSATTLSLSSIAFNATILAPYAAFTGTGGQINGQLIANSAAGTTSLNNVLFTGDMDDVASRSSKSIPATPEPSTWLLLLTGVALFFGARWCLPVRNESRHI